MPPITYNKQCAAIPLAPGCTVEEHNRAIIDFAGAVYAAQPKEGASFRYDGIWTEAEQEAYERFTTEKPDKPGAYFETLRTAFIRDRLRPYSVIVNDALCSSGPGVPKLTDYSLQRDKGAFQAVNIVSGSHGCEFYMNLIGDELEGTIAAERGSVVFLLEGTSYLNDFLPKMANAPVKYTLERSYLLHLADRLQIPVLDPISAKPDSPAVLRAVAKKMKIPFENACALMVVVYLIMDVRTNPSMTVEQFNQKKAEVLPAAAKAYNVSLQKLSHLVDSILNKKDEPVFERFQTNVNDIGHEMSLNSFVGTLKGQQAKDRIVVQVGSPHLSLVEKAIEEVAVSRQLRAPKKRFPAATKDAPGK